MPTEKLKRPTKRARAKGRKAVDKKAQQLKKLKVTYVAVADLRPNTYNPNRQSDHDFELLCRSMEEDGFTQPIVALKDKTIVDGEHRWRAAKVLNLTEIPVVYVTMTPEQMKISTMRHNRARGSEDMELSAEVLRDLRELGALDWAQDSLMLDDVELERLLADVPAPEALREDQLTEAWDPGERADGDQRTGGDGTRVESMTPAAADALRDAEKRAAEAKDGEEKAFTRKDAGIYRLACSFAGDEADVVKSVIGDAPARGVLDLCIAEAKKRGILPGGDEEGATDPEGGGPDKSQQGESPGA